MKENVNKDQRLSSKDIGSLLLRDMQLPSYLRTYQIICNVPKTYVNACIICHLCSITVCMHRLLVVDDSIDDDDYGDDDYDMINFLSNQGTVYSFLSAETVPRNVATLVNN